MRQSKQLHQSSGHIRDRRPPPSGFKDTPTELVKSAADLSLVSKPTARQPLMYYHPALDKWLGFPPEVPTDPENTMNENEKRKMAKKINKKEVEAQGKVGENWDISGPSNFKKLP
jgi:hypothetical protein